MHTVSTKTKLLALDGTPIRRVAVGWREALQAVQAVAKKSPGASLGQVLELTASTIAGAEGSNMTLADAVADALLGGKSAESCTGSEKLRRWKLALRFEREETVELEAEDVVFIEGALAEAYKPAIYGPAHDALNGVAR